MNSSDIQFSTMPNGMFVINGYEVNSVSIASEYSSRKTMGEIITSRNCTTDKNSFHAYCDYFYEKEFARYRDQPIQLIEIGIARGGSLALWGEYFTNAKILGLDIDIMDPLGLLEAISSFTNITIGFGDAYTDARASNVPIADIIIDDGPHEIEGQLFAITNYLPKVKPGGIFVIEDVRDDSYFHPMMNLVPPHLKPYAECIDLRPIKGRPDDLMFIVRIPE